MSNANKDIYRRLLEIFEIVWQLEAMKIYSMTQQTYISWPVIVHKCNDMDMANLVFLKFISIWCQIIKWEGGRCPSISVFSQLRNIYKLSNSFSIFVLVNAWPFIHFQHQTCWLYLSITLPLEGSPGWSELPSLNPPSVGIRISHCFHLFNHSFNMVI